MPRRPVLSMVFKTQCPICRIPIANPTRAYRAYLPIRTTATMRQRMPAPAAPQGNPSRHRRGQSRLPVPLRPVVRRVRPCRSTAKCPRRRQGIPFRRAACYTAACWHESPADTSTRNRAMRAIAGASLPPPFACRQFRPPGETPSLASRSSPPPYIRRRAYSRTPYRRLHRRMRQNACGML